MPSTVLGGNIDDDCPEGQILEIPNLKIYTSAELKCATRNFRPECVLGEGRFGRVYKGWVDGNTLNPSKNTTGMVIAVKKLNRESITRMEWQSEINFLGRISHPNVVKLLGYCMEDNELILVHEFMAKGSLDNHLFRRGAVHEALPWSRRLKILIDATCGLAFLHSAGKQIIYRNLRPSKILLDSI
ncbi:LOW QUALITY PROTEIN: hypothetical protein U9M48_025470 [Paspalum notatum var. saurae]|uniref:non-specific serine/threonine protein kinase n=1 Tax=Paspalum notatum var. saurae TaxID=547442 RepID=A0AAQ3WX53_PASNO